MVCAPERQALPDQEATFAARYDRNTRHSPRDMRRMNSSEIIATRRSIGFHEAAHAVVAAPFDQIRCSPLFVYAVGVFREPRIAPFPSSQATLSLRPFCSAMSSGVCPDHGAGQFRSARRAPAGIERRRAARHGMRSRTALKALRVAAADWLRPAAGSPASVPAPLHAREAYARRARPVAVPPPIARNRRRRTKASRRRSTSPRARYRLRHRAAHRSAPNRRCWPPNAVASRGAASRPPAHRGRRQPQRGSGRSRQHSNCSPTQSAKRCSGVRPPPLAFSTTQ